MQAPIQPDIIMLNTDDHNHHQSVTLVKLANPCHDQAARTLFEGLCEAAQHEDHLDLYHGAVAVSGDDNATEIYTLCENGKIKVIWI